MKKSAYGDSVWDKNKVQVKKKKISLMVQGEGKKGGPPYHGSATVTNIFRPVIIISCTFENV